MSQFAQELYGKLSAVCTLIVAVLIIFCLIRAVRGPQVTDRIVAVNMIGTMTIGTIAILSDSLGEGYLLDVCLIYAMISFLAIVVLARIYTRAYRARRRAQKREEAKAECSRDSG